MKKFGIYKKLILPSCMAFVGLFSSCSMFDDFLTVYPTNQITGEQFWEDKNDLTSVLASCYKQLTTGDVAQRMLVWGELRSDNFILKSESDENIRNIMNANLLPTNSWFNWSSYYKGIAYCNLVLSKGEDIIAIDPSFTESDWKPVAAECKALRALYYFYLVRAFRDVPFNVTSTDTSEGATDPVPQTSSQYILTYLINDLEGCKDDGMINYGNSVFNTSRITKDAIYTILADLYLWRAAKNASADSAAVYPGMSQSDYAKCIECCDYVMASKLQKFQDEHVTTYYGYNNTSKKAMPMYAPTTTGRIQDEAYNELFGSKNSLESIFEVAYDGSNNSNSTVQNFYGYNDGSLQAGIVGGSAIFQSVSTKPDQTNIAYGKTDLRAVETIKYASSSETSTGNSQIIKFITTSIEVLDGSDVTVATAGQADNVNYGSYRSENNMNVDWILYRTSDVALMKAEAIACLYETGDPMIEEGFNLVNAIFDRSNPSILTADRLLFSSYSSPSALYSLVMRERQREFFGEGKRWFDLVRMALRDNSTQNMLNLLTVKYSTNASAIKAKLATLNSLFSPIRRDEIRINPALVQNPAWVVDESIERN